MSLKLMYITNNPKVAVIAEKSGVDWIFVDLEINGKEERQGHLNTVISKHCIADVKRIKSSLSKSKLIVRINPIYDGSEYEINEVICGGADIIMLPFFKNSEDVQKFVDYIDGRVETCLLCETPEAVKNIDSILEVEGIDYIHVGLNDLHLGYKMKFMFELLADGTVEMLCKKIRNKRVHYGFGGIARLGGGMLPAENIIIEHYRLGSEMVILSRSFCDVKKCDDLENVFNIGVSEVRNFEATLREKPDSFYESNKMIIKQKVLNCIKN